MKNLRPKHLALVFLFFLVPFLSHGGSIRDVRQSIERVKSIAPPFQFALIGDSRDGEKVYGQLLRMILDRKPDFIIHLGDMISKPGLKEWNAFFEASKGIDLPFFPVVGNHDVGNTVKGEEMYRKQFLLPEGKAHYSFHAGGKLFGVLDSERGKGRILEDQWSWLEESLVSSSAPWKLVFIHRPLFLPVDSLKQGRAMDRFVSDRDNLHRLFARAGVKAVFAGDDHRYDRREKDRIYYVISGGGGAPLSALKDRGGYFHYVWVSAEKEKLEGEVIDLEGQIRDRFTIQ